MLRPLVGNEDKMHEQMENFSREMKTTVNAKGNAKTQ